MEKRISSSKKPRWKKILRLIFQLGIGCIILGFFIFAVFATWISRELPDPNSLSTREVAQSTKIYDRTGTHLLYELHGDAKRTLIKLEDIPDTIRHATVAIEDKRFYEHHGVYWKGLVRAVYVGIIKRQTPKGTSTLTQQLVKNAILTNEHSLLRKIKEFLLALQIERLYTKDQILQMYLNEIPYGSTIYGIESASQSYFGKPAKELTIDEAALLAAIPQAPDYYSPYGTGRHGDTRAILIGRQQYIISQMMEQGYITKEQAVEAKAIDVLKKVRPRIVSGIEAPHFVDYIQASLIKKYGVKQAKQGGLRVVTTLDWEKQKIAEEEVRKGVLSRGEQYKFTNAALISLDPKTGQILAMVGSYDYYDPKHDGQVNVTLRPRQPGSSFKPIVYAVGFMRGYLPETQLWDVNTTFKQDARDYEPRDYDLKERGPVSIRQALQGSLNIPAVKMLYLSGVGRVLDFAEQLGYTTLTDRSRFGLALVLGGGEVTPLEHAGAYATFATEGVHFPSASILKVEDSNGQTLEEWQQPQGERAMDPQIARILSNVLSDNQARAYIFGANNSLTLPDRQVAAKTGTTNNYHDAWTAGYTPNLVTVVWVGNNDNSEMKRGADGSIVAAPIWQGYMKRATKGLPIESFNQPDKPSTDKPALLGKTLEQKIKIDRFTGKQATEFTPPEFIEERSFFEAHTLLYYVDKDDPTGPMPTNPNTEPQYANWENGVQTWVKKTNWHSNELQPIPPPDDIHTAQNRPQVSVIQPFNGSEIGTRLLQIQLSVNAPRPIARVDISIDGIALGSIFAPPWETALQIPNSVEVGTHQLYVRVFDDVGNVGGGVTNINLTAEKIGLPGIVIDAPVNEATWSKTSFPHAIDFHVTDPTIYQRFEVSFVGSDNIQRLVGIENNPSSNPLHVNIPLGPPSGRYRLEILGIRSDGGLEQTQVFINVTP